MLMLQEMSWIYLKEKCEECQLNKRKIASKGIVVKPFLSKDFSVEDK
jgi:hypothetical protein